jgi:periplasmic protein CpxP/Spy
MLKHCLLALLLAGLVYTATPAATAQDNGSNDQQSAAPAQSQYGHRHFDPQKQTEMLTKHLNLTSDQQPKVLDILKSQQSQMESLRSDTSLAPQDRRSKMMDIHKTSNDQIRALLTPDQQKKFDAMQSRHEHWQNQGAAPSSDSSEQK